MTRRRIAAVLFEGFEMLDLYGPLEMFSMYPDAFQIVPVAERPGPIAAARGPHTVAVAGFDSGDYHMVLVPGGEGVRREIDNPALTGWLTRVAKRAEIACSVCTGAALLAATGLLDGRKATTNKLAYDWVAGTRPAVDWQCKARWVEAGRLVTASGVSAGTDMALALIARLMGDKAAEDAALWAEYIWNRDPDDDPFSNC